MTVKFECPLTSIQIAQKCPVDKCMYWAADKPHACLAYEGIPDSLEMLEPDIARSRKIALTTVTKSAVASAKRIQRLLMLDDFLNWVAQKSWRDYPDVHTYHDPKLIAVVHHMGQTVYPFKVRRLGWNMGKVAAAVNVRCWTAYLKARRQKIPEALSPASLLMCSTKHVEMIQQAFQEAVKRSKTTSTNRKSKGKSDGNRPERN